MIFRVEMEAAVGIEEFAGRKVAERIESFLGIPVAGCRLAKVFTVQGLTEVELEFLLVEAVWHDPILQQAAIGPLPCGSPAPDWFCEISFRPGVTDNEGRAASEAAALALHKSRHDIFVSSAVQYRFYQNKDVHLDHGRVERICRDLLCNELIQEFRILSLEEWKRQGGFKPRLARVEGKPADRVESIALEKLDDKGLENLSRKNTWALNLAEMRAIASHFAKLERRKKREEKGLPPDPTDVEMEALAQTWSEHCKHKIFASKIHYVDEDEGRSQEIDNLYKTCIRDTTALLRKWAGANDWCRSVFSDNAGVIAFINGYDACIKVETHNSPSALDPYGGALTGIVGVNRDPLGTGMGADLVCNIDVFCFASPFYADKLPPRVLHPARIFAGVRQGVEDGGNQSGIPTVNGSFVFDPRYLGKPLVFCGTIGLLPACVCGHPGYEKAAKPGDAIVMLGGRIGKDGIHGATFSSEELHINSPVSAVQIGDPITQRKMYDFILRARDACLYHAITDNGAGGLSSSVGEMAEDTGGCRIDLDRAPLKYDGLLPWEILVSEAQERMTLAVPQEKLQDLLDLAAQMDVEASVLGTFTSSGYFEARYKGRTVAWLNMDFLHHGAPQLHLNAVWKKPAWQEPVVDVPAGEKRWQNSFLKAMLGRLNICSKESVIRQYDHEVRGGSAIKPLVGVKRDGPSDGAVFRPLVESDAGLVVAHGICPKFSDFDTYWMVANAMDEAIRNAVAVGANPDFLAGVDNFCWCDPIQGPNNPEGAYHLAQLVRACQALRHYSLAFRVPCISGKDSMKNDYVDGDLRISIPPTLLFTVMGVIDNVIRAQSSDFKKPGDYIYMLGGSWRELGGSEAYAQLEKMGGAIPHVDARSARMRYQALHGLMGQRAISACHDCSDGGLAVALAEMCIGGRLGCEIDLDAVPAMSRMNAFELLYTESASRHIATVKPELAPLLDALGMWQCCRKIGEVTANPVLKARSGDSVILEVEVEDLAEAFKSPLAAF